MASSISQDLGLGSLNVNEQMAAASVLSKPADEFGNSEEIEMQWAVKAYGHAETYFNLICAVEPKLLRLTPYDDVIYQKFRAEFPDDKVAVLNQDIIKSKENKEKWRPFCESFKGIVDEYNFASLIRTDCTGEYSEANTFVVPKIQFLAFEIARNREGHNSELREKFNKKKAS